MRGEPGLVGEELLETSSGEEITYSNVLNINISSGAMDILGADLVEYLDYTDQEKE